MNLQINDYFCLIINYICYLQSNGYIVLCRLMFVYNSSSNFFGAAYFTDKHLQTFLFAFPIS